jgi:hypothetical protein
MSLAADGRGDVRSGVQEGAFSQAVATTHPEYPADRRHFLTEYRVLSAIRVRESRSAKNRAAPADRDPW